MNPEMFSTLQPAPGSGTRRSLSFVGGLCAQAVLIAGAVLLGLVFPRELPMHAGRYVAALWLPPVEPKVEPAAKPPARVVRVTVPKIKLPPPQVADLRAPELVFPRVRPPVAPTNINVPPPPIPALPSSTPSVPPKPQIAVTTGLFGEAPQPPTTQRPASEVQTGGFGSPQGLPGRAQGNSPGNVPKLGSFGLPDGPGVGNGTGGSHGIQGIVASAGFGNGPAGAGNGSGGSGAQGLRVSTGGFEPVSVVAQTPSKGPRVPPPPNFQPVEILSKPTPPYTEEARQLGIQGEVALSVIFQADGTIKVLGVERSLGHGLDQTAEQAAALIRFKPALRDGKATDFPATLRIQFRLAEQTT